MNQPVRTLDERYIEDIGHAFGYYDYGQEAGLASFFRGPEQTAAYIRGFARGMLQGGFLHTMSDRFEGFIAYKLPGEKLGLQTFLPLLRGVFQSLSFRELLSFAACMKTGGPSLRDRFDREKKPYIFVGMVCVREEYQHQGYMRKLLEPVFSEADRLGVPVVLDTDARSKCEKYLHLGMELAGTRDLGAHGTLYDLMKYPKK